MISVSQAVEEMLRTKPFVIEALCSGIINVSSLSRTLIPALEQTMRRRVNQGAVVMAINRMVPGLRSHQQFSYEQMVAALGDIIVHSNLADYTYRNSATMMGCHRELLSEIGAVSDAFYTIVRGVFESTVVVGRELCGVVERVFGAEQLTYSNRELSAVTVKLSRDNVQHVGVYYQILKFLAWEGINVKEVISTSTEFSLVVGESEVDAAFALLQNLKRV